MLKALGLAVGSDPVDSAPLWEGEGGLSRQALRAVGTAGSSGRRTVSGRESCT